MLMTIARKSAYSSGEKPERRSMLELSISSNARNEWCFSKIDVSLYSATSDERDRMRKRLLTPGCSRSWQSADVMRAKRCIEDSLSMSPHLQARQYVVCVTSKMWVQLWYGLSSIRSRTPMIKRCSLEVVIPTFSGMPHSSKICRTRCAISSASKLRASQRSVLSSARPRSNSSSLRSGQITGCWSATFALNSSSSSAGGTT
mmetsp:Transcript_29286/g.57305  ORF Transcript_29286/g.57305 Transcript_29286/m.57305 type:complete len:202 (-) Transcript_29286:557-1162(-)